MLLQASINGWYLFNIVHNLMFIESTMCPIQLALIRSGHACGRHHVRYSNETWGGSWMWLLKNKTSNIGNICNHSLIARFMGPTWGPSGADRTQVGPMLDPWSLLPGLLYIYDWNCVNLTRMLLACDYHVAVHATMCFVLVSNELPGSVVNYGISNTAVLEIP